MIFALRSTLLWTLGWMFAFGFQFISLNALAKGRFSPVMYRMTEQPVTGLPQGFNAYQALGLEGPVTEVTSSMIEAAAQRRLTILEQGRYTMTPEFEARLATAASRQALLSELSEASYLMRHAASRYGVTLDLVQEATQIMDRHLTHWQSAKPGISLAELNERARASALSEVIEKYKGQYGSRALQLRSHAHSTLADSRVRYKYDFMNGLREGRAPRLPRVNTMIANRNGAAVLVIPNSGGATVSIDVNEPTKKPMSSTMKAIKNGAETYGLVTLSYLILIFTYGLAKITTDYASNPLAYEDILKQYLQPVYALSFFTFAASASTFQLAQRKLILDNLEILNRLAQDQTLFANAPTKRARVAKSAFAGLSGWALAFGFAASMGAHYLGSKALSCMALLNDGPMSKADRALHEQTCDMSFQEFVNNAGQTLVFAIPSLLATRMLLVYAGNAAAGLRGVEGVYHTTEEAFRQRSARYNNRFNDPEMRTAARRGFLKGMARGLPAEARGAVQAVRVLKNLGVVTIHMAAMVILVEVGTSGMSAAAESFNNGRRVGSKEGHLRKSFEFFVANNMSLAPFCNIPLDSEGKCPEVETLFKEFTEHHQAVDELRNYHMRHMTTAQSNWTRYFSNALNMYQASSLFYSDVLDQISAQRRRQSAVPFTYFEDENGELGAQTYLRYADHPLPLFRSSPLFGVRPEYVNESWFKGLSLREALIQRQWESGQFGADLEFVQENLLEKMTLAQEAGNWILSQLDSGGLPDFLKDHARYIGNQLASGSIRSQISGLKLLHDSSKIFPWSGPFCRSNERSARQPECLFFFAQQMMMDVLLGAADLIENEIDNLPAPYQLRAQTIVELLRSSLAESRESGKSLLHQIVTEIKDTQALACETQSDGLCIFRVAERLATAGPFNHRNRPDYGGYIRELSARPNGPLSLAPGHKYFMDFYTSLEQYGLDYDWYPARRYGNQMGSMSHYFLISMLCGPDAFSSNGPAIQKRIFGLIPGMPQFFPPRLPTISGQNYCDALKDETSVYHSISRGDGGRWHGIVDLLFHDVATQVTGSEFSKWWKAQATTPMENLLVQEAAAHGNELRGILRTVLIGPEGFWGRMRNGLAQFVSTGEAVTYLDSINSELDVYFWSLFYPIYEAPDTLWYEPSLPEGTDGELEIFKREYLAFLESELRDGFEAAIREGITNPGRLDEIFAGVDLTIEKLMQLFQGWSPLYLFELDLGMHEEYPQLSYRNRAPRIGWGYDANVVMEVVFGRLMVMTESVKSLIRLNATFLESQQDSLYQPPND